MKRRIRKCIHPDTDVYYNHDKLLSYGCDVSINMSIRDLGKSYSMLRRTLKKSADRGRSSVVSRWDGSELGHVEEDMFDPSEIQSKENPDGLWTRHAVSTSTWFYERVDNGARVWFVSVKGSNKLKGLDIKNLDWWFYDEFIPEIYDTQTRRLQEFDRFCSLYWTLVRNNERFRVVMSCNTITWFNSYFEAWDIRPFPSGHIMTQRIMISVDGIDRELTVAMENIKPTRAMLERIVKHAAIKGKRKSAAYFENATDDRDGFISNCPSMGTPLFDGQWVFMGRYYSFRFHDGTYYWCETVKRPVRTYTTSKSDVGPGIVRDRQMGVTFDVLYDNGKMRFSSGHVEQTVLSMIWASRQNQI